MTSSRVDGRAGRPHPTAVWWWSLATAIAVLLASAWVRSPGVQYLALGFVATAASLTVALRLRRRLGWVWITIGALLLANVVAIPPQIDLHRVSTAWAQWDSAATHRAGVALKAELDGAIVAAQSATDAAVRAATSRERALLAVQGIPAPEYDRGLAVFQRDSILAWTGEARISPDSARPGVEAISNALYDAIRVTRVDGFARATAVILVDARPPADTVSRPLARSVARTNGVQGFVITPTSAGTAREFSYEVGGRPLLSFSVVGSTQDEVTFEIRERARVIVSAVLAIALLAFIVAVWRNATSLWPRLAVVGLALLCTAIVPVNQYSNVSRLFTPAIYYAPIGRELTANAGALTISAALALLALIAFVRSQRRIGPRSWSFAVVVLVAVLGPFLLRALANGIQFPLRGADPALWLMWEVPLFLAGVVVVLAGATAGSVVLGPSRGAPPGLAALLAIVAALVGPMVWEAPGQWPGWYTYLWIGTIAALALSRRSRYLVAAASLVAALGAMTLVWGRSARGRVSLAEADLAGLSRENASALPLLQRFGDAISSQPAARTRVDLLTRYAASDLAAASFPVSLAAWTPRAVAPKSRLFGVDPYAQLLGLEPPETTEPPYTVQLRERMNEPSLGNKP
ncbi:MAG TPA: hypothetical protein VIV65_04515, partial [Gemmatimonadaceae bacterium]